MSDNHKKNISKNYSLNISSKETTLNSVSVSNLLKKSKKNQTQNKLILCQYPTIFKEEFGKNDTPVKGARLFSAKTHRAKKNTKLVKKNSLKNICNNQKNKINIELNSQRTLKNNNNNKHIFFTGLNDNFQNKKMKLRLKSATIHKQLDKYSRKSLEMKKKFNLFEIYKRSNYYNQIVVTNKKQRKFLSNYLKKDLELNQRNSNINNYQEHNNSNNNNRCYYNQLFNRMLTCFLEQKKGQSSPTHINSCGDRNYRTLNLFNSFKKNSCKLNEKLLFSKNYNNIYK
jgi:hypothetical protein